MRSEVFNEDVFDNMKRIKDKSINLIICDGPYFKICGGFDWVFKTMQEWIAWNTLLRDEFERILTDNGSLFVFGDEKNIAYLQVEFDKKFNLLNSLVYKKVNALTIKGMMGFNSFAPVTERILFYDKGENKTGLEMIKKIMPNPFAEYLRGEFGRAGITNKEIAKICGVTERLISFWKKGDGSLIQKEQYLKVRNYLNNEYLRKEYEYLRKEYEYLRRPFHNQFKLTDVIDCKVQSSFHPTTKDTAVIEKLILTTTKENDLVFSPFLGSGTDRIACYNTKRNLISCEINKGYFDKAEFRYQEHIKQMRLF